MSQIRLTTTGSLTPLFIQELGNAEFIHPVTNFVLTDTNIDNPEFSIEDLKQCTSLQLLINLGHIELTTELGIVIPDILSYCNLLLSGPPVLNINLDDALSPVSRVFAGGRTTFTVTHNFNTLDLKPEVFRLSDGRTIGWRIERTTANTIEASRSGNVGNGLFRILI